MRTQFCVVCSTVLLACLFFASFLQAQDNGPININSAPQEVLQELEGIGPALADRIVAYRDKKPFESKEEIIEVKGIGEGTYKDIQDDISIE
ncbi:MAG: helix-hairpin-helix domain-containing protein [Desulfovermiculus sp.]